MTMSVALPGIHLASRRRLSRKRRCLSGSNGNRAARVLMRFCLIVAGGSTALRSLPVRSGGFVMRERSGWFSRSVRRMDGLLRRNSVLIFFFLLV